MSDIAAYLGQKNETIDALLAENIRLREQIIEAVERERKIAAAGEKVALRLAEFVKAASDASTLLGENDIAWPDYAEEAWNILGRALDPRSLCQANESETQ